MRVLRGLRGMDDAVRVSRSDTSSKTERRMTSMMRQEIDAIPEVCAALIAQRARVIAPVAGAIRDFGPRFAVVCGRGSSGKSTRSQETSDQNGEEFVHFGFPRLFSEIISRLRKEATL